MSEINAQTDVTRIEPPFPEDLTEELLDFWETIFEIPCDGYRSILNGLERDNNHDIFYLIRKGKELGGTSHLTISKADPRLGGLGEVATPPEFRRQGIATALCAHTLDDFCRLKGQAFFLGTVNPEAARVYHRLGWRRFAGTNVMALVREAESMRDHAVRIKVHPRVAASLAGSDRPVVDELEAFALLKTEVTAEGR